MFSLHYLTLSRNSYHEGTICLWLDTISDAGEVNYTVYLTQSKLRTN